MAIHRDLPIYKAGYDLFILATEFGKNMNRDFKRSIGEKISNECLEILTLVYRANVASDKVPHITELIERLQVAELLIRVAMDRRLIAKSIYAKAIELSTSIGKQAHGWRRPSPVSWGPRLS